MVHLDDWVTLIENLVAEIQSEDRVSGNDDVETIYGLCRSLIREGRQVTQAILAVTPTADDQFAPIQSAAVALEQQLDILERDLTRLFEYRNSAEQQATAKNAFQVQVDYLAVDGRAERLYTAMTFQVSGIRVRLGDLRDAIGRTWDNVTGTVQHGATAAAVAVGGALANFGTWIVGWLKQLGTNLLQLIAKLVTPKEWSISGQAGTNLMIFQGAVTLEVTFG